MVQKIHPWGVIWVPNSRLMLYTCQEKNNNLAVQYEDCPWIITGHVIYNPAYTYKFQLKTTLAGFVILALIKYERGGHAGHFRTAFNQLISWKYSLVSTWLELC